MASKFCIPSARSPISFQDAGTFGKFHGQSIVLRRQPTGISFEPVRPFSGCSPRNRSDRGRRDAKTRKEIELQKPAQGRSFVACVHLRSSRTTQTLARRFRTASGRCRPAQYRRFPALRGCKEFIDVQSCVPARTGLPHGRDRSESVRIFKIGDPNRVFVGHPQRQIARAFRA